MPGPATLIATVIFDPQTQTLAVEPPSISLDGGKNVQWRFQGVPAGWRPGLRFAGPSLYGPFQEIRKTEAVVSGVGNSGIAGTVAYVARVTDDQGNTFESPEVQIDNQASARLSSLQLTVSVNLASQSFFVVPFETQLLPGGTVMWNFVNLPAGYAPAIRFEQQLVPGSEPSAAGWLGPFETLSRCGDLIVGVGQAALGRFTYAIDVLSVEDGKAARLVSLQSGDPVVDSEGDPPAS